MAMSNKTIFYERIEAMLAHLDYSSSLREVIEAESKHQSNKKQLNKSQINTQKKTINQDGNIFFAFLTINKAQKIDSFKMIGMTDPVNGTPEMCHNWFRILHHESKVYPESAYDPEGQCPPSCIFVPETKLLKRMIETCALNHYDINLLFVKFSCLDQAKPQWLLEQEA